LDRESLRTQEARVRKQQCEGSADERRELHTLPSAAYWGFSLSLSLSFGGSFFGGSFFAGGAFGLAGAGCCACFAGGGVAGLASGFGAARFVAGAGFAGWG
jgi:hypothetical protein